MSSGRSNLLVRSASEGFVKLEDVLEHVPLEPVSTSQGEHQKPPRRAARFERHYIASVLSRHRGRMEDAAKSLGSADQSVSQYRQLGIGVRRAKSTALLLLTLLCPIAGQRSNHRAPRVGAN